MHFLMLGCRETRHIEDGRQRPEQVLQAPRQGHYALPQRQDEGKRIFSPDEIEKIILSS